MMDLGLKAQSENNLPHAAAYFKEAFHINPYSIDPLERIIKLNNANQKSSDNYGIERLLALQLLDCSITKLHIKQTGFS